ncbi:hypothetical protein K402DRAFT_391793 [Aulographum hederae CBS 113979]|uniref:Uncharacterized protein n=1 Tax=Aulographum hederae CBS 113979 TaxID=1176131 RepID=A0A6G1H5R7_9PEZI|nr:hypothetical protein K402DRAFT_391793 [Aulographum hederae CBS 113979]
MPVPCSPPAEAHAQRGSDASTRLNTSQSYPSPRVRYACADPGIIALCCNMCSGATAVP